MTKIACCMIVRNAERTIGNLLASIDGVFDEYVFVDTGSTDQTRKKILDWAYTQNPGGLLMYLPFPGVGASAWERGHTKLASFEWIDDFAAARNYAFSLATSEIVGYLDADDELTCADGQPVGAALKKTMLQTLERNPHANAVAMPYLYTAGVRQDVVRFVKADAGFTWKDEVHEFMTNKPGTRNIIKLESFPVLHDKNAEEDAAALERNQRIARRAYEQAVKDEDGPKIGRMANHLAQGAQSKGDFVEVRKLLRQTVEELGHTTMGAYARGEIIKTLLQENLVEEALDESAQFVSRYPEYREAWFYTALSNAHRGAWFQAAKFFDKAFAEGKLPFESVTDVWFIDGVCTCWAARAYVHMDRLDDAIKVLSGMPTEVRMHPKVQLFFVKVYNETTVKRGLKLVHDMATFLIWDTEATKALKFLDECVPNAVSSHASIQQLRAFIRDKTPHLKDWESYQKCYAGLDAETYHTDAHLRETTLNFDRARGLIAYAKQLGNEGPTIEMCAVGFQDGIIEQAVLDACDRIHLTVVDVHPDSGQGLAELQEKFPDRVDSYAIVKDHYDWAENTSKGFHGRATPPIVPKQFDLIDFFEVLEHVPDDRVALRKLCSMLKPDGKLFISTPIASEWVEDYLTNPDLMPKWYGHVRAHNHVTLWEAIRACGLDGTLCEPQRDATFLAELHRETRSTNGSRVAIFVPSTPKPFNPFSHLKGFVGGSEEAVIHLSEELAALGHRVTVFAPPFEDDGVITRGHNSVMWRPADEFFPGTDEFDEVLYWRCPEQLPEKALHKKLLWLHDAWYDAPPEFYERADSVMVLSRTHGESIARHDDYKGPFAYVANGIDAAAFPELGDDKQRDPHKVIYASSPDRGLKRLLHMWPAIRSTVPDATLDIYYDWTIFRERHPKECAELEKMLSRFDMVESCYGSVTYKGGVDHATLHEAFRGAAVWAYPHSGEAETFCITAVKAMASGCWPVTSRAGSLPEVTGEWVLRLNVNDDNIDTKEGEKLFLEGVLRALEEPISLDTRKRMRAHALKQFAWPVVAKLFEKEITGKRHEPFFDALIKDVVADLGSIPMPGRDSERP